MHKKALLITPVYVLVGLLLFAQHSLAQAVLSANARNAAADIAATQLIERARVDNPELVGKPVSLSVPRLGIDLNVADGSYDVATRSWTLTKDKAHYAVQTQPLNNRKDLTLIYGHNTLGVFYKTRKLVASDVIEVKTDNGLLFSYVFVDDKVVSPTDTSIFDYRGKPRLALLACTGTWNESRRIMNFDLVSVRKAN